MVEMKVLTVLLSYLTVGLVATTAIDLYFGTNFLHWPRSGIHNIEERLKAVHRFLIYPVVIIVSMLLVGGGWYLSEGLVIAAGVILPIIAAVVWLKRWIRRKLTARAAKKADEMGFRLPMNVAKNKNIGSTYRDVLGISDTGSVLCLGETRSGKTEVSKHMLSQVLTDADEPVVVFDFKDDYQEFLDEGNIQTIRISGRGDSTHHWNLFREVGTEQELNELGRALFPENDSGGSSEFFSTAARQLFVAVLKYLVRESAKADRNPSNEMLVRYFQRTDAEQLYEDLTEYDDLVGPASAINPDASKQAAGVYATVQQRVNDVFVGDFAQEGTFSIREYMEDPQGQVLVLDFPKEYGEMIKPAFRFFIDHAARHALTSADTQASFVLDEFARIPHLRRIGELVNVGAGQQTQVILTLQSVNQLYENYGEAQGTSILSGLVTSIILQLADDESMEYARTVIGTEFEEYTKHVETRSVGQSEVRLGRETKEEEEHPFAKGDFRRFDPGVAVVVRPDGWAYGYIPQVR